MVTPLPEDAELLLTEMRQRFPARSYDDWTPLIHQHLGLDAALRWNPGYLANSKDGGVVAICHGPGGVLGLGEQYRRQLLAAIQNEEV